MPQYQVAWKASTHTATVQAKGDALPAGATKIGTFEHANVEASYKDLEFDENHVLFHHVRDALYHVGVQNMQAVIIAVDTTYTALTSYTVVPATVTLAPAATQQLTHVFTPSGASNKALTYTSSNPAKATVSTTGLITAVATGTATITVTSDDGAIVRTCVVTIS